MPEFTVVAVVVCVLSLGYLVARERWLFKSPAFWIAYAIVLFFEVLMDGWLTKLHAPIVIYESTAISGIRFPFDIPIEDFLFGFPLVVFPIVLWVKQKRSAENR